MDLNPAGARTYEPLALLPSTTYKNAQLLLRFYELTGKQKYLDAVPKAIEWLELTMLSPESGEEGRYTHPTFVEPESNRAIFVHRKGSNVKYGRYYFDYHDTLLLSHYSGKTSIDPGKLKNLYDRLVSSPVQTAAGDYILDDKTDFKLNQAWLEEVPDKAAIRDILASLDETNRWLTRGAMISHPYAGDGKRREPTHKFAGTHVGDETDTSPFRDSTDQEYISTGLYIKNMRQLISYLNGR